MVFLLVAMAMGNRLVGRPIDQLVQLARRIGEGHLEARVHLHQRDELDTLARGDEPDGRDAPARAGGSIAAETAARLATLEHLRHADRLTTVGKLASGVAHELGTPLNVVLGRAKMIASGEAAGDEVGECARIISQQAAAHDAHHPPAAGLRPAPRAPARAGGPAQLVGAHAEPAAAHGPKRSVTLVSRGPEALRWRWTPASSSRCSPTW